MKDRIKDIGTDTSVGESSSDDERWEEFGNIVRFLLEAEPAGDPVEVDEGPTDWPEDEEYDRRTGYKDPSEG